MTKRIFALLLCVATLLSVSVGCAKKDEDYKGQYITVFLTDNIYDLDPAHAYGNEAVSRVVSLLFDPLFRLTPGGKVEKALVSSYKIIEDPKAGEYKMELRLKHTNWSDGTAVSANDIVFAWKRLLEVDADYGAASLLFDIKNARKAKEGECSIDDVGIYPAEQRMLEIRFEGKIDYKQFLLNLTSPALAPLRDDIVSKSEDWAKKPGTMVTSGPFRLSRLNFKEGTETYVDTVWDRMVVKGKDSKEEVTEHHENEPQDPPPKEQLITDFILERNAYYYRNPSKDRLFKSVTPYRITVDCSLTPEQMDEAYRDGMLLYIGDIPLALRRDSAVASDAKVSSRSLSTNAIYLDENALIDNGTEEGCKLFADARVRRALSMAVDRAALADAVVYAKAATGLLPTGVFEAGSRKRMFRDACDAVYGGLAYNRDAAAALLREAGVTPSDYSFSLTCAAYDEVHRLVAETVVNAWKDLGFRVTLKKRGTIPNNDYYRFTDSIPQDICDDLYAEDLRKGRFEAILFDSVAYSVDPFSMLSPFAKPFSGRPMDMSVSDESADDAYVLTPHITGYDSEAYNALMEQIFAKKTISDRADLYREAEAMLMEDMPVIPLLFNLDASVTSPKLKKETVSYYNTVNFKKCKISSYDKYVAAGKAFVTDHFADMKFTESKDCAYKEWEVFKTANTVYAQFFLDEKAKAEVTLPATQ